MLTSFHFYYLHEVLEMCPYGLFMRTTHYFLAGRARNGNY